jgi:thioredoxin-dependent peroxiredoxin
MPWYCQNPRELTMSKLMVLAGLLSLGVLTSAAPVQTPVELKEGDAAPAFSLPGSDGKTHTLAQYKGRAVILAWFPAAFTGG